MKITREKVLAAAVICVLLAATYHLGGGYAVKGGKTAGNDLLSTSESALTAGGIEEDTPAEGSDSAAAESGLTGETARNEGTATGSDSSSDDLSNKNPNRKDLSAEEKLALAESLGDGGSSKGVEQGSKDYSQAQGMEIDKINGKDKYLTDPVPEGKPVPVEPQNTVITDRKLSCTLSVRCDTILGNMDSLDPEKAELVPSDGILFPSTKVDFYEGESVFNVLLREMKKNKIHMEYVNTPIYNSAYIEGINNLYEFDCGELSGWMYKVNGWFPNYGCSRYQLKAGDVVEWVYTCDLGRDVGGFSSAGGE